MSQYLPMSISYQSISNLHSFINSGEKSWEHVRSSPHCHYLATIGLLPTMEGVTYANPR